MIHAVKTWPKFYAAKVKGIKPFEVRKNDRPYKVGDYIASNEYDPLIDEYTGNAVLERITYILDDPKFCKPGFVVLGTRLCPFDEKKTITLTPEGIMIENSGGCKRE